MHIPDGFLANRMAIALDVLSGAHIAYASKRLKLEISVHTVPIMGVLSAFIFAAQMLNFPIFGGTSGHLLGGALLGILLGPVAGMLTMTTVIVAQALFLQDGGLLALGANLFNMGAITVVCGYFSYRLFGAPERPGNLLTLAGFAAGWSSVVLSAAACALELGLSGAIPLNVGLPAMVGYYAVIGIAEGALTAGVLSYLTRVRPDLLQRHSGPGFTVVDGIGGAVLVAVPVTALIMAGSSSLPDPLQALLVGPAASADNSRQELLSIQRLKDSDGLLLYLVLLAAGMGALWAARKLMVRRDRS